jgi:hypothetical protein
MTSKKNRREPTPEDILRDYHPEIQAVVEALRRLVKQLVPAATEKAYPGWGAIGYRHPTAGYFCGIFPQKDEVHLLFEWGVLLPDSDEILTGETRRVRYIPIRDSASIDRTAIGKLMTAALDLPESSAAKKQMIKNLNKGE